MCVRERGKARTVLAASITLLKAVKSTSLTFNVESSLRLHLLQSVVNRRKCYVNAPLRQNCGGESVVPLFILKVIDWNFLNICSGTTCVFNLHNV